MAKQVRLQVVDVAKADGEEEAKVVGVAGA